MGCHGNHAFSHRPYQTFFLRTTLFRIQEVPINNLAPMRNRPGGARYVKSDAGVSVTSL